MGLQQVNPNGSGSSTFPKLELKNNTTKYLTLPHKIQSLRKYKRKEKQKMRGLYSTMNRPPPLPKS